MSKIHPSSRARRGLASAVSAGAVVALAASALAASPALASSASGNGLERPAHRAQSALPDGSRSEGSLALGTRRAGAGEAKIDSRLIGAKGQVSVMLELDAAPTSHAFGLARRTSLTSAKSAAKRQAGVIARQQSEVVSHLSRAATKGRVIYPRRRSTRASPSPPTPPAFVPSRPSLGSRPCTA